MPAYRWFAAGGLVLFIVSLWLPAIEGAGFPAFSGLDVLRQGASGWRDGVVAWYANPLILVALLASWFRQFRFSLIAALAGTLLALSSFSAEWMAESAGRSVPSFQFAIGFYVWLLAFVFAVVAAAVGIYKESGRELMH